MFLSSKKLTKFIKFYNIPNMFENLSDVELITEARNGKAEYLDELFSRYKPLALKISRKYFISGGDEDDIFQEAMIGLFKGYQNFKVGESDFKSFATLCINRQIQSAVKNANRFKNKLLSDAISLQSPSELEEDEDLMSVLSSNDPSAEKSLIAKENFDEIIAEINKILSPLEKKVLILYLDGKSYKEISNTILKSTKSVENALTRIKCKLAILKK